MFMKSLVTSLSVLAITLAALPVQAIPARSLPRRGTVLTMTNGDIMCYIELRDARGKKHTLGATFELCERPQRFLNRKVLLTYKRGTVNDCQSAEPCGKSRWETLVVKLKVYR
jgi:hypothetical protein